MSPGIIKDVVGYIKYFKSRNNLEITNSVNQIGGKIIAELSKCENLADIEKLLNILDALSQDLEYDSVAEKQWAEICVTEILFGLFNDEEKLSQTMIDALRFSNHGFDLNTEKSILKSNAISVIEALHLKSEVDDPDKRSKIRKLAYLVQKFELNDHETEKVREFANQYGLEEIKINEEEEKIIFFPPDTPKFDDVPITNSSLIRYNPNDSIYTYSTQNQQYSVSVFEGSIMRSIGKVPVAIKRYTSSNVEIIKKFIPEGEILQRVSELRLSCFLDYYGHFEEKVGDLYMFFIVMELCKHDLMQELTQRKSEARPYTESELKANIAHLLEGFESLRKVDITHKDIKPHNIFISKSGLLKIGDFNISKSPLISTMKTIDANMLQGTEGYWAPEIEETKRTRKPLKVSLSKCDVFSLGLVFLQMTLLREVRGLNSIESNEQLLKVVEEIPYGWLKTMLQGMFIVDNKLRKGFARAMSFIDIEVTDRKSVV